MNTVFYLPQKLPVFELEQIKKWASYMGYKVVAFAHNVEDLKKELLKWNPIFAMVWEFGSVQEDTKFLKLMSQYQQHFYSLQDGKMHYPAGVNYFMVKDHLGELLGDAEPPRFYQVQ